MKRFLQSIMAVALVALFAAAGTAPAQAQAKFGIKAGLNVDKFKFDNLSENLNPDNGCGFVAGVMGEYTLPIIGIGIDASLLYANMNVADTRKSFIDIPVNLKYKFNVPAIGQYFKPFIATGPDFAFKMGSKDDLKTFQCAWNVGIGFEFFSHLQLAASYGFGINNVLKAVDYEGIQLASDIKAKNNYWTISAAWLF